MTLNARKILLPQSSVRSEGVPMSRRDALQTCLGISALAAVGMAGREASAEDPNAAESPLHFWSLKTLSQKIRSRDVSSVEVTRHMLERIARLDGKLKSYQLVTQAEALATAERCDREIKDGRYRGPLHGVPIGIKDLLYTKGIATIAGTKARADFVPEFDATVVKRLAAAGAVSLGKLVLCEGAWAPYHPDLPIPVNPWDADKWSGVSSSGSGVATAAGLCFGSIGSDTGGSIRYPSAANGCVGLKPTYGRVSRHGVFALADSLDHVGPMTRTVEDSAIMFEVMAGHDPLDPSTASLSVPKITGVLEKSIKGMKVGFDRDYATKGIDQEMATAVLEAVDVLAGLGAEIVEIAMPDDLNLVDVWVPIALVEAVLANNDLSATESAKFSPGFREVLEQGRQVTATDYAAACQKRREVTRQIHNVLAEVNCLACPSMANPAQDILKHPTVFELADWKRVTGKDVFTKPFNLSGVPTLSVPCGFSRSGLPLSLQLIASPWGESDICRVGHAYERATMWHRKHPNL